MEYPQDLLLEVDIPLQNGIKSFRCGRYTCQAQVTVSAALDAEGAANDGDLRLVRQHLSAVTGFVTGALQIFLEGDFGAVCSNRVGPTDAEVACRQMGFVGGAIIGSLGSTSDDNEVRPYWHTWNL